MMEEEDSDGGTRFGLKYRENQIPYIDLGNGSKHFKTLIKPRTKTQTLTTDAKIETITNDLERDVLAYKESLEMN